MIGAITSGLVADFVGRKELMITASVSLAFVIGTSITWRTLALTVLLYYSLFGSILTFGGMIRAITSGPVADFVGRKEAFRVWRSGNIAIDFDTRFASFVLGDNPILSSMLPISSLPPLMVCGVVVVMTSLVVTIMAAPAPTSDAIDFDTGFASFVLGDNPILSSMSPISSLPPLMVCGVGDRYSDDVIGGDDDGCTCSH
ncbi:hypothetical protein Tco_0578690 [Tanacetum coccineum]